MGQSCPRIVRAVLLGLAVLILAACTSTAQTAKPTASAGAGSAAAAVSGTTPPCAFEWPADLGSCASTDPAVKVESLSEGDTSMCSFGGSVDWGDGDKQNFSFNGAPDGTVFDFANHTFTAKGTYTITVTDQVLSGMCTWGNMTLSFTYGTASATASASPGQSLCSQQSPSACLIASSAVAGLDTGDIGDGPDGMTLGTHVADSDGFAGADFTDGQGNVIIADEDASLASPFGSATAYQNSSFLAEVQIYNGLRPAALSSAVQFAQQVAAANGSARIYVTGLGLGGVEAEAQAQALGSRLAGGVTFGAPGLPGYQAASGQGAAVTDFADYGDPVGNWSSDPDSELADLASQGTDHYGDFELVGNPLTAALPRLAANTHKLMVSSALEKLLPEGAPGNKLIETALKLSAVAQAAETTEKVTSLYDSSLQLATYAYLAGGGLLYHSIAQYASDLNVSLAGTVAPAISMAEYYKEFDPNATTATLQAAASTTVSAAGAVSAPGYTVTGDASTGEPGAQTFADQSGSQYDVTDDPAAQVSSLAVNDPDGTSYVIANDDSGQQEWSARVYYYSGPGQTGTLTGALYDWRAGGSQLHLFAGLPPGVSKETLNYSQPDGAGTLVSKTTG